MQYVRLKYMHYVFLPSFMEILTLWGLHEFWLKIVEFIFIVYGKNMNKKHGAKKLAMSTKQMQDIFSPMFFLCPQGDHLQCF